MNKYLGIAAAVSLTILFYGCQPRVAQKPASETSEAPLPINEIFITQDGQAVSSAQTSVLANNSQTSMGAPTADLLNNTAEESMAAPLEAPTVKNIQQALTNAGIYNGKIDGDIGPKTKKAIREFQEKNNLKADGKVGPRTWKRLSPFLNNTPVSSTVDSTSMQAVAPAAPQNISN